jgi:hypothetical protein
MKNNGNFQLNPQQNGGNQGSNVPTPDVWSNFYEKVNDIHVS